MSTTSNGKRPAENCGSSCVVPRKTWTAVYLQDLCYQHQYIRSRDASGVFELPERLRAVNVGIAAALSRLGEIAPEASSDDASVLGLKRNPWSLAQGNMHNLNDWPLWMSLRNRTPKIDFEASNITVVKSLAKVDLTKGDDALAFVHDYKGSETYIDKLARWARKSRDRLNTYGSELPKYIMDPDLYLCPGSIDAITGSIGTILEAVDNVMESTPVPPSSPFWGGRRALKRAFVAIRPPGHHCDVDMPAGFCWVNNVAIAAARAFMRHRINRVVILDIDLHHGNGTQAFAKDLNQDSCNPSESTTHFEGRSLKVYYGSIHDILSYPCEDGDPDAIEAASLSVDGTDEQYIKNIHLKKYATETVFWNELYKKHYLQILTKAKSFIKATGKADDVLVLISCGFDASEHEDRAMSRHGRKVPVSFYYRFTRDAVAFAERYAHGRIISILEGGYSDRALISGVMAHLCGLADTEPAFIDETWWNVSNLVKLEQSIKNPPSHSRATRSRGKWIQRSIEILSKIDPDFATTKGPSWSQKGWSPVRFITPGPTRRTTESGSESKSARRSGIAMSTPQGFAVSSITKSDWVVSEARATNDIAEPKPKIRKIDHLSQRSRVTLIDRGVLYKRSPDVSTTSTTTNPKHPALSDSIKNVWRPVADPKFASGSLFQPSNK